MIVHTNGSPGYTPRSRQSVTSNVFDKTAPLLVIYWTNGCKARAAYMQTYQRSKWLDDHVGFSFSIFNVTADNMRNIVHSLKVHKINEHMIEVYDAG